MAKHRNHSAELVPISLAVIELKRSGYAAHFGFLGVAWWENRIYPYTFLWSDRALQEGLPATLECSVRNQLDDSVSLTLARPSG